MRKTAPHAPSPHRERAAPVEIEDRNYEEPLMTKFINNDATREPFKGAKNPLQAHIDLHDSIWKYRPAHGSTRG